MAPRFMPGVTRRAGERLDVSCETRGIVTRVDSPSHLSVLGESGQSLTVDFDEFEGLVNNKAFEPGEG